MEKSIKYGRDKGREEKVNRRKKRGMDKVREEGKREGGDERREE